MSLIVAPFCEVAMDTLYYFHRWLLWIALIVLLYQCQDVSGAHRECPQGQLLQHLIKHRRQYTTCCYPTRCAVGEQVKPCTVNGTRDTCIQCLLHYNQSLRTSSFTMEPCVYWPLDSGCKTITNHNFDITDWRTKRCMCNIEHGMKFDPPESMSPGAPADAYCQRMRKPCLPGHEPTVDGDCVPCKDGFFKSEKSYRLCEPKTNCSLLGLDYIHESNATGDNVCSEPEPVTTPKPVVTEKPTPAVVIPKLPAEGDGKSQATTASTTENGDTVHPDWSRSTEDGDQDSEELTWPIIVTVVIFLIIVVVAISITLCYRKRKGKAMCICASTNNCTDPEKSPQNEHTNKLVMGNGVGRQQYITGGDKVTNNNVNGGLPTNFVPAPNVHLNGDVPQRFAPSSDQGNRGGQPYYPANEFYPPSGPPQTSRSGILGRPSNAVYAQNRGNVPDKSIDSILQEKLKVNVGGLEANQALGEHDSLLVAEPPRGAAAPHDMQFQNLASSANNSPPVMPPNINPTYIYPTGPQGANFINSGHSSPPVQPQGTMTQVTFAPAAGAATFTRSTSVIASPEGEVDEDEIEANVPRFSQLLPDTEDNSGIEASANARAVLDRDPYRADSPARETTQQLRAPSQRLMRTQCQPAVGTNNNNMALQQQRRQGAQPPLQPHRPGHTPAMVGPVTHGRDPHQSDHRIMNLKEQELAESLTSNSSSLDSQVKHPSDLSETEALKTLNPSSVEAQQTELKTHLSPIIDSDFSNTGASAHVKTAKAGDMDETFPHTTEPKLLNDREPCPAQTERKRQGSGGNTGQQGDRKRFPSGNNVQNVRDRKRAPSGGSNSSAQNTLERRQAPGGDQQKPCIKSTSADENDSASKKQRYNRTVSFEEDETSQTGSKQRVHTTEPWQSAMPDNTSEKTLADPRHRGPLRSVSDPEQKASSQDASDEEERKCASLEYNASTSSSKNSVNSDQSSGGDSSHTSPSRTALYRRSQSENASSNESPHKPPPRSMSEEKPQKADRPIAKVKPMPASDNNTVSQSPVEVSDNTTGVTSTQQQQQQQTATVMGSHTDGNNILNYSSDESDLEHDVEGNITTSTALDAEDDREEISRRRPEEQESRESGSR